MDLALGLSEATHKVYIRNLTDLLGVEMALLSGGESLDRDQQEFLLSLMPNFVLPPKRNELLRKPPQYIAQTVLATARALALAKVVLGFDRANLWIYSPVSRYAGKCPVDALIDGDVKGDDLLADLIRTGEGLVF